MNVQAGERGHDGEALDLRLSRTITVNTALPEPYLRLFF